MPLNPIELKDEKSVISGAQIYFYNDIWKA